MKNLTNKEFDEYIKKNNQVVLETRHWIVIKDNDFNQLICFSKSPYVQGLEDLLKEEFLNLQDILQKCKNYKIVKIYINPFKLPNDRLHLLFCPENEILQTLNFNL